MSTAPRTHKQAGMKKSALLDDNSQTEFQSYYSSYSETAVSMRNISMRKQQQQWPAFPVPLALTAAVIGYINKC
jgi:hypothetical protein